MCIVHQVGKINVKPADEQTDDMKAKMDINGQSVTKSVTKFFQIGVTPQKNWKSRRKEKLVTPIKDKTTKIRSMSLKSPRIRNFSYPYPFV